MAGGLRCEALVSRGKSDRRGIRENRQRATPSTLEISSAHADSALSGLMKPGEFQPFTIHRRSATTGVPDSVASKTCESSFYEPWDSDRLEPVIIRRQRNATGA